MRLESKDEMVTLFVMGKKYRVPGSLTIMKAMEYTGHQFRRGAGCRGGFCGACATLYRKKGSYKLEGALACQKIVEDGMYIAQIPFSPTEKKTYKLEELKPDAIWLMGNPALESFYMGRVDNLQIGKWRGRTIPDRRTGIYVSPMFHPSFILRRGQDEGLVNIWTRDMRRALNRGRQEFPPEENLESTVRILTNYEELVKKLSSTLEFAEEIAIGQYLDYIPGKLLFLVIFARDRFDLFFRYLSA